MQQIEEEAEDRVKNLRNIGIEPVCLLDRKRLNELTSHQLIGLLESSVRQKEAGDGAWLSARRNWLASMDMTMTIIREHLMTARENEAGSRHRIAAAGGQATVAIVEAAVKTVASELKFGKTAAERTRHRLHLASRYLDYTNTASLSSVVASIVQMSEGRLTVTEEKMKEELLSSGKFSISDRGQVARQARQIDPLLDFR